MKPYHHFTLDERKCLQEFYNQGKSIRQIAKELGRSPSTISREIKRNYSYKKKRYHHWRDTILYITRRKNCKRAYKLREGTKEYEYVLECLQQYWSPETISNKARELGYVISTKTIYQSIKRGQFPNITRKTHFKDYEIKSTFC